MAGIALRVYLAGLAVLVGAIAVNVASKAIHLATWYDFLQSVPSLGLWEAVRALRWIDALFLLLIYPALLGLCAWLVLRK